MGFLDNSGDIILDAILTDVGRKRMAEGKFNPNTLAYRSLKEEKLKLELMKNHEL